MSAEVVSLGERSQQAAWRLYETEIKGVVERLGYNADAADWVVADLAKRSVRLQHDELQTDWQAFPPEVRQQMMDDAKRLSEAYKQLMVEWLIEIVRLECELWEARQARGLR